MSIDFADSPRSPKPKPNPSALRPKLTTPAEASPWPLVEEATTLRWVMVPTLLVIITLYAIALFRFYAGAHGGVDQAGYLMTARLITGEQTVGNQAATHAGFFARMADQVRNHLSFVPETPFQFGSRMCIVPDDVPVRIYAKYPFGYPLMAAVGRVIVRGKDGVIDGMYLVNPICTVLACYFAYFLFRTAISRFLSLIGVIFLACNPLILNYAHEANSHAPSLFCVVFGFWGLLSWWRTGSLYRGVLGAFALGYACTIRYTEFLLVLPVVFAVAARFRFTRKSATHSLAVLSAWAIPVGTLAIVCWICFGAPWKTGYTYCNEDTGFSWRYFLGNNSEFTNASGQGNWETFSSQLNTTGLYGLWPMAVIGLLGMLGTSWRLGVTLLLWIVPPTILYMFYYWAPQGDLPNQAVHYLRFFVTIIPGMIFGALWLVDRALHGDWLIANPKVIVNKYPALIAISLFNLVAVLLIIYFRYFEWPEFAYNTTPPAYSTGWVLARYFGLFVGPHWMPIWAFMIGGCVLTGCIWNWQSHYAPQKVGMILGVTGLAAFSCGINLDNTIPIMEMKYAQQNGLRQTMDMVRDNLPKGSMIFADTELCQLLDSIGGYQLVDINTFAPWPGNEFSRCKRTIDRIERSDSQDIDPDPVQLTRARLYVEMLGQVTDTGIWIQRRPDELKAMQYEIIDKALARGQRVAFMVRRDFRDPNLIMRLFTRADMTSKQLMSTRTTPPPLASAAPFVWQGVVLKPTQKMPPRNPGNQGISVSLYEVVRAAQTQPGTTSATQPAAR